MEEKSSDGRDSPDFAKQLWELKPSDEVNRRLFTLVRLNDSSNERHLTSRKISITDADKVT